MANGYTYEEKVEFGFYDWTVISREEYTSEYGCTYTDDCPCCTCDDDVAFKVTYARPRWSKSLGRMVETQTTEWLCSAHA